jgi:hypothetical protein
VTNDGVKTLMNTLCHNRGLQNLGIVCSEMMYNCIDDIQNMLSLNKTLTELNFSAHSFSNLINN